MIGSISDIQKIQIQLNIDARTDALIKRESDLKRVETRLQSIEEMKF